MRALVRPGKQFKLGNTVQLTNALSATITAIDEDGIRTIQFSEDISHPDLIAAQHVPLPPYIKQDDTLVKEYQTIYAKELGSKAAPTAGLHFTPELIEKVKAKRDWSELTLHVGLGTFAPLSDKQLAQGKLHKETYEIDKDALQKVAKAKHVTAVGTTSVRTLETVFRNIEALNQNTSNKLLVGSTDMLIQPGYNYQRVNSLITNFHLPGTSLLLLVAAFIGSEEELMKLYYHAITVKYRFYSFGDCMLIL